MQSNFKKKYYQIEFKDFFCFDVVSNNLGFQVRPYKKNQKHFVS